MEAKEFYRKRLIEIEPEGIMKRLAKVVSIDKQAQICEDYHQHKLKLLNITDVNNNEAAVCGACKAGAWCYACEHTKTCKLYKNSEVAVCEIEGCIREVLSGSTMCPHHYAVSID